MPGPPPTAAQRMMDSPAMQAKIGSGMAMAALRQGWKELGQAFGQVTPESISIAELGGLGSPATPGMITSERLGRPVADLDR